MCDVLGENDVQAATKIAKDSRDRRRHVVAREDDDEAREGLARSQKKYGVVREGSMLCRGGNDLATDSQRRIEPPMPRKVRSGG